MEKVKFNISNADLEKELNETESKAWRALARYKFMMFGYWAAVWVHINKLGRFRRRNPWRSLTDMASQSTFVKGGKK